MSPPGTPESERGWSRKVVEGKRKDGEDSSGLVSGIKPELELIFLARINKHWRGLQHQRPAGCVSQQNPVLSG